MRSKSVGVGGGASEGPSALTGHWFMEADI